MTGRAKALLALLGMAAVAAAKGPDLQLCRGHGDIEVETLVFSGTPNPKFSITGLQRPLLCNLLRIAALHGAVQLPSCRVLGFTGWRACRAGEPASECVVLRGSWAVDELLLRQLGKAHPELPASLLGHIRAEGKRLRRAGGDPAECAARALQPIPLDADCSSAPRGPDDPKQMHYDPKNDDDGCFVKAQEDNNCYDYATDIATGTFAQPGRGSGVCAPGSRPCVNNTCDDVRRGAVSDGLTWVGTDLPTSLPEKGHYVSLHIWPDTNFHWLRMDADLFWSHKPGGTEVRNVDNNGQKIQDPSKADVSPWSNHCGYLLVVPSGAKVNQQHHEHLVVV